MSVNTSRSSGHFATDKTVVQTGDIGDAIKLNRFPCSVALSVAGGASGKVQFTLSSHDDIATGNAIWFDWSRGVIAANAADIPEGPITGVRAVSASGVVTLEAVC